MLMSATNGIELEIPWVSTMRSLLHTGCCSLLPAAPVVNMSTLDSPTRDVGPAVVFVHMHACMPV